MIYQQQDVICLFDSANGPCLYIGFRPAACLAACQAACLTACQAACLACSLSLLHCHPLWLVSLFIICVLLCCAVLLFHV